MSGLDDSVVNGIIIAGAALGAIWSAKLYKDTMSIEPTILNGISEPILGKGESKEEETPTEEIQSQLNKVSAAIEEGAQGFLVAEYQYVAVFMVVMSAILVVFLGANTNKENSWVNAALTTVAFNVGGVTSLLAGYAGMHIAVKANVRTSVVAYNNPGQYGAPFAVAFKAGGVMGFSLTAMAVAVLFILVNVYKLHFGTFTTWEADGDTCKQMYECIAGFGLGGSSVALFGRVGGGIYTKAADVGADIFKLEGLKEDDPKNPAVIADNVGDNVGDIAGMGADLFGSFAESASAAMIISSSSPDLFDNWGAMNFPIVIGAVGIVVCIITSLFATDFCLVKKEDDVESSLKWQLIISTTLMTPLSFILCYYIFPATFDVSTATNVKNWYIFFCVAMGLWSGLIIGLVTEYYTSKSHAPTRELAEKCRGQGGAPTNIIYGLALGYKSTIIPVFCLATSVFVCYTLAAMYGVACGAIGILSTLAIGLTIDAYGPICDNAGGLCEMSEMPERVRDVTDALDAAGNTTAAIGKGFAIGSAAMVSLALFGAFVSLFETTATDQPTVNVLEAWVFAGLLVGAMLPYWFSAMTMKSVGEAAREMANEVERQFKELNLLGDQPGKPIGEPQYKLCVEISTRASLKEMIAPGALVLLSPLLTGYLFGVKCLAGLLVGALTSGVQMAISASNSGGAWDNAKKYVEGQPNMKGTDWHKACVVGDTVGDPMKDTSGPSLNILIKLTAITSVVFGPSMAKNWEDEGILAKLF